MAERTLTSMNSVLTMSQDDLFPVAVKIEEFATDAAVAAEDIENGVAVMGVDGKMSYARVPYITVFTITLQADSKSIDTFQLLEDYEKQRKEKLPVRFNLTIPGTKEAYTFTKCVLTNMTPLPPHQRTLGQRTYRVSCERIDRVLVSN